MVEIREVGEIEDYHAHVYFDAASREAAWALRELIEADLDIQMGRFHEKNVGPHPRWSYQVLFGPDQLDSVVPWLMLNRGEFTVFLPRERGHEHTIVATGCFAFECKR